MLTHFWASLPALRILPSTSYSAGSKSLVCLPIQNTNLTLPLRFCQNQFFARGIVKKWIRRSSAREN
jgi:hypothetical protein